jgi:hypothetical protein
VVGEERAALRIGDHARDPTAERLEAGDTDIEDELERLREESGYGMRAKAIRRNGCAGRGTGTGTEG